MDKILSDILRQWNDQQVRYLFPSEVAADFWRLRLLEEPDFPAVPAARFLSWDQFKEKLFALNSRKIPVNSRIRRIYTEAFLGRFSRGEVELSRLVSPDHRTTAGVFQGALSTLLPHLHGFFQALARDGREGRLDTAYLNDLNLLYRDYTGFLERFDLFEPTWEKPEMADDGETYRFYLWELVEDVPEYLSQLHRISRIHLIPMEGLVAGEPAKLELFDTALEEVETLCSRLSRLLSEGAEPGDLVITLGDEELLPLLLRTARRLDLPLTPRMGRPLGEYPPGRLFTLIKECGDDSFSLESLKALLMHRGFPWRDRALAEKLIRFGAENYCLRNTGPRPGDDLWETMFSFHIKDPGVEALRQFYRSLRKGVEKLGRAGSFTALSAALETFLRQFMDTDVWEPRGLPVLQRIRIALAELQLLETRLPGFTTASPLSFFIQDLTTSIYVPRHDPDAPGVAVYPYRVSAGIFPPHHFLAGLSQKGAEVQFPLFPFLREDQRAALELEERDLTGAYLEVYLRSGLGMGASCARESARGVQLAPGMLVARGGVIPPAPDVRDSRDIYREEERFWSGERGDLTDPLSRHQREGWEAVLPRFLSPRKVRLDRDPLPLEQALKDRLFNEEGLLKVSPYRLDQWLSCPAAFLFQYGWALEEPEWEARWEDPREKGNLRHRMAETVFAGLGPQPFPEDPREILPAAGEEAEKLLDLWEARYPLGQTPFWGVIRRAVRAELEPLLGNEAARFPGFVVVELEEHHDLPRPDWGVHFSGVIDRVVRRGGALGVVDYKSSFRHALKSLIDADGRPFSYQMVLYILFLADHQGRVEQAVYYDFGKGRFIPIIDEETDREVLFQALETDVREFVRRVRAGQFHPPRDCDGCDFRFLCRKRYLVREEE